MSTPTKRPKRGTTQYTKQIGEALVCAELGRRGLIASAFSGNVKDFDVIAVDAELRCLPIQVKAFTYAPDNHPCWPLTGRFLDIRIDDRTQRQTARRIELGPVADLIHVFVLLKNANIPSSRDRFFVCSGMQVQDACLRNYQEFLAKHDGRRPRNPSSTEVRLRPSDLKAFQGWTALDKVLKGLKAEQ